MRNITATFASGGGILNTGVLTLRDGIHVTGNRAEPIASFGGGMFTTVAVAVPADTLVCDNQQSSGSSQCSGTFTGPGTCPNPASGICP